MTKLLNKITKNNNVMKIIYFIFALFLTLNLGSSVNTESTQTVTQAIIVGNDREYESYDPNLDSILSVNSLIRDSIRVITIDIHKKLETIKQQQKIIQDEKISSITRSR